MPDLEPGSEFAGYRIDGVIGRGGMGVVYRARDPALDRPVAIKLVNEEYARDGDARRRFEREARLAASIDHPNVIPIYAAGEHDGHLYLVMRYVDGIDLQALLAERGRLTAREAAQVTDQIGRALDAAHQRGLVHRDIKPANVILSGDHAYLTDFGVTRLVDEHTASTDTGKWVGTLDYTSPEQLRSDPAGPPADVYSLGCLLHTCLTGTPPFKRATSAATITAHLYDEPPGPGGADAVPKQFEQVLRRALAKQPAHRYRSAGELGAAAIAAAQGRRLRPTWFGRRSPAPAPPASHAAPLRLRPVVPELGTDDTLATVVRGEEPTRSQTVVMPARADAAGTAEARTGGARDGAMSGHARGIAAALVLLVAAAAAAVALVLSGAGAAAPTGPLSSAEITAAVRHFAGDYSHHDVHALSRLLAADVMRLDPTSVQRGRAATLAQYAHQFTTKPVPVAYRITQLSVTPGWAGRAQASFTLTVTGGGKLSGHVVFGLQRGPGGRVQLALISTR